MGPIETTNLSGLVRKSLKYTFDKIFPLIICLIGASIQVTTLVTMYFEFPTSTIIEIYRPSIVTLPAISICYNYKLNLDMARAASLRFINSSWTGTDLRYQLPVNEIDLITPWFWDLIAECKVALPASIDEKRTYVDCVDARPIAVNINAYAKCFTLFARMNPGFSYKKDYFYDDFLLRFTVNWNVTLAKSIELYIHETKEELSYSNGSPWQITLDCGAYNLYVLSYLTTQSYGLGSPYSKCKVYSKEIGKSRHDIIKKCMAAEFYEDNQAFHDRTFIQISDEMVNTTFKLGVPLNQYRTECEEKYPRSECHTQLYQIQSLKAINEEGIAVNQSLVLFAYPLGFQSNVTTTEKLNFIEYFCYVASVISLWLEVSLLGVVNFLFHQSRKAIFRVVRKRRRLENTLKRVKVTESRDELSMMKGRKLLLTNVQHELYPSKMRPQRGQTKLFQSTLLSPYNPAFYTDQSLRYYN